MDSHEEIGDTDVRERMYEAVFHGFILQTHGYDLPTEFGMFDAKGNAKVRKALGDFIDTAKVEAQKLGLTSEEQRFSSFQNPDATGRDDLTYDEFFGHAESFEHLKEAMKK